MRRREGASTLGDPDIRAVIVAEFDIDKGSVIRAQYPAPLDAPEDALAEHMLPEGAHNHEADWTYFAIRPMLTYGSTDSTVSVDAYMYRSSDGQAVSTSAAEGSWMPFCSGEALSLTIQIASNESRAILVQAGRAERLRAPLHAELQYTVLQDDFVSYYVDGGVAMGFHFRSKHAQQAFSTRVANALPDFDDASETDGSPEAGGPLAQFVDAASTVAEGEASCSPGPVWVLSLVCTRKDRRLRRGAEVKAIAIASTDRFLHAYKPVLVAAMKSLLADSAAAADGSEAGSGAALSPALSARAAAQRVFESLASVDLLPCGLEPGLLELEAQRLLCLGLARTGGGGGEGGAGQLAPPPPPQAQAVALWGGSALSLPLPRQLQPASELGEARASLLVATFGPGVVAIQRALLCGLRVLFIGQTQRAASVCAHVLAAPLLVSPPLGSLLPRLFPYASLGRSSLGFLETPGYVAGVTNPMFACRQGWWDLLCDVDSGQLVRPGAALARSGSDGGAGGAEGPRSAMPAPAAASGCALSPQELELAHAEPTAAERELGERLCAGVGAQLSERWVRELLRERVRLLVRLAAAELQQAQAQAQGGPLPRAEGASAGAAWASPAEACALALRAASQPDARLALRAACTNASLSRAVRAAVRADGRPAPLCAAHAVQRLRGQRGRDWRLRLRPGAAAAAGPLQPTGARLGLGGGAQATPGPGQGSELGADEAAELLACLLEAAESEPELAAALAELDATCATGALTPIASLVLHSAAPVRALAARLLQRLEGWPQLRPCVRSLNPLLVIAYEQQLKAVTGSGGAL